MNYFIALIFSILSLFFKSNSTPTITLSKSIVTVEAGTPITTSFLMEEYFIVESSTTTKLVIVEDTYQNQYDRLGIYSISCYALDAWNQKSTEVRLFVQVVDKTPPVIRLKTGGTTILADHSLSNQEIIELFEVSDNYDTLSKDQLRIVQNTCKDQMNKPYEIIVELTDNSGNKTIATFSYYLIEHPYQGIKIKDIISVEEMKDYTNEELLKNISNEPVEINPYTHTNIHLINAASPLDLKTIQNRYPEGCDFKTNYEAKVGSYDLEVTYLNQNKIPVYWKDLILVRDFIAPKVIPKKTEVEIDLMNIPKKEYFINLFDVSDNLNDSLILNLTGIKQSDNCYKVTITATDQSLNTTSASILCYTYSSTTKTILPITLEVSSNTLSSQELLALFLNQYEIKTGYISIHLDTNYYYNHDGIYKLSITTTFENDIKNIYICKINLQSIIDKKKEDTMLIYTSLGILIAFFFLGVIIYIKRYDS